MTAKIVRIQEANGMVGDTQQFAADGGLMVTIVDLAHRSTLMANGTAVMNGGSPYLIPRADLDAYYLVGAAPHYAPEALIQTTPAMFRGWIQ